MCMCSQNNTMEVQELMALCYIKCLNRVLVGNMEILAPPQQDGYLLLLLFILNLKVPNDCITVFTSPYDLNYYQNREDRRGLHVLQVDHFESSSCLSLAGAHGCLPRFLQGVLSTVRRILNGGGIQA